MTDSTGELGVIQSLIERFEKHRLPRLLKIKKKVEAGEGLSSVDIEFLDQVTHDARQSKPLIDRHPEWHKFCSEVIHLYEDIIEKALKNEGHPSS